MQRLSLGVEYDGSNYHGWQKQNNGCITVQEELEKAISKVANHNVDTVCSGRTDTGVHATEQVVHFDTSANIDNRGWLLGINVNLPDDIRIVWVKPVLSEFNARFDAFWRRYRYFVYNSPTKPALLANNVTWTHQKSLDCDKMQLAAAHLLGKHDFSSFRAAECQSHSAIRNLVKLDIYKCGDLIVFDVIANAFLHHMVRNIVGTLLKVGEHDKPPSWVKEVLAAKNRASAGPKAPAKGLYLVKVYYEENVNFAENDKSIGPWFFNL